MMEGVGELCLYATIVPLLAYALFGPSRIIVLGPDSALAAVILAVVLPLSAGEPQRAVAGRRLDDTLPAAGIELCFANLFRHPR